MVLAEGSREGVRITVSDSGIGIAPEQQERVFSPFNREDEGVGSSIGGLGLALVRRYVSLHGGTVELHSEVGSGRSEEHTSELQSLMRISYAVFCLKKKN